jgi:transposase
MHKIENQFKVLHGSLLIPIKPVYHWTDQKIEAHNCLCMTPLLFGKTFEYLCRDKIKGDFRTILDYASSIRSALIQKEGKPKLVFEALDPAQQQLMETFSLSRFARK